MKPLTKVIFRVFVGLTLVAFVLSRADLSEVTLQVGRQTIIGVSLCVLLLAIAVFLSALRWLLILGRADVQWSFLCRLHFIGWFFSLFLPTSIGGDGVRAIGLSRTTISVGEAISSIAIERMLGIMALLGYLFLGFAIAPHLFVTAVTDVEFSLGGLQIVLLLIGIAVLTAVTIHLYRRFPRITQLIKQAADLVHRLRASPTAMMLAFVASLLVQGAYILAWYSLGFAVGLGLPHVAYLIFVPFVSLAAMAPITISGLGVREGAWVLLLIPFGISIATAVGFSLLYYLSSMVIGILGGGLFMYAGLTSRSDTVESFGAQDKQDRIAEPHEGNRMIVGSSTLRSLFCGTISTSVGSELRCPRNRDPTPSNSLPVAGPNLDL